jgi:hypothetical protein
VFTDDHCKAAKRAPAVLVISVQPTVVKETPTTV